MVTALDQPSDRVRGLEAGADDFLTKPVTDLALISRVRSLARLKMVTDELRMRAVTSQRNRHAESRSARRSRTQAATAAFLSSTIARARTSASWRRFRPSTPSRSKPIPTRRLFRAAEGNYELVIVSLDLQQFRRLAAVQPDPLARAHAQCADPGASPSRQQRAACARAGDRRQRLSGAADRQERAARARAHADQEASATPNGCATTCRCRSRWRSPTR